MTEAPVKEEAAEGAAPLTVKVQAADGGHPDMVFKLRPDTQLNKLMTNYCQRTGTSIDQLRFLFDGERIRGENTPAELAMEDGDIINVVIPMTGGFF